MQTSVNKTAMPMAAGILSIISGAGKIIGFLVLLAVGFFVIAAERSGYSYVPAELQTTGVFIGFAIVLLVFGVISIVGGVYTLQRRNWGFSLTAAILAFLPFNLLGLAAIILVAMSKREFDVVNLPPQTPPPMAPVPPGQPNPPSPPVNTDSNKTA